MYSEWNQVGVPAAESLPLLLATGRPVLLMLVQSMAQAGLAHYPGKCSPIQAWPSYNMDTFAGVVCFFANHSVEDLSASHQSISPLTHFTLS